MTSVWALAALWLGLAVIAGLFSIWLRASTALSEIMVGTTAQLIFSAFIGSAVLGADEGWVKFLAGIGAIVLTFLAGAELDPIVFRLKWKEAAAVGLASFLFPPAMGMTGKFQVMGKYAQANFTQGLTRIDRDYTQKTTELNLNYIIRDFNARVMFFFKDTRFDAVQPNNKQVGIGVQLQI